MHVARDPRVAGAVPLHLEGRRVGILIAGRQRVAPPTDAGEGSEVGRSPRVVGGGGVGRRGGGVIGGRRRKSTVVRSAAVVARDREVERSVPRGLCFERPPGAVGRRDRHGCSSRPRRRPPPARSPPPPPAVVAGRRGADNFPFRRPRRASPASRRGTQSRVATRQDGTHHQQQGEGPGDRRVTATTERRGDERSYSAERRGRGGTAAPRGWAYPFAAARLLLGAAIFVRAHNLLPIERGRRRVPFLRPLRFVIRDRRLFCHSPPSIPPRHRWRCEGRVRGLRGEGGGPQRRGESPEAAKHYCAAFRLFNIAATLPTISQFW